MRKELDCNSPVYICLIITCFGLHVLVLNCPTESHSYEQGGRRNNLVYIHTCGNSVQFLNLSTMTQINLPVKLFLIDINDNQALVLNIRVCACVTEYLKVCKKI